MTCSDRCRQIKRRQNYITWKDPQQWKKDSRRAERELKKIERQVGSLDIPTPDYPYLTLRMRIKIRLERSWPIQFCKVCWKPYVNDTPRRIPACQGQCSETYMRQQQAIQRGLETFAGRYDPRVDVRLRLGLPIKTCKACGIPFPDYHPKRIYCSQRCNQAAWRARNPERTCIECGRKYQGKRRTCSAYCKTKRWRRTATFCDRCHRAIKPGREMRYEPSYNGPNPEPIRGHRGVVKRFEDAVFCSGRCRDAVGWLPSCKSCIECNTMFYPKSKYAQRVQRYCGKTCGMRAAYRARRERERAALTAKHCDLCGEELPMTPGWSNRRFCTACRVQHQKQQQRESYARRLARRGPPPPCRWCSGEVPPGRPRNCRYCSDDCLRQSTNAKHRVWYAQRRALGVLVRLPVREGAALAPHIQAF